MKNIVFLFLCVAAVSAEASCLNRTVTLRAPKKHFKAIQHHFMLFSSLPYNVKKVSKPSQTGVIQIEVTYAWPGKKDEYSTPNSMELGQRVYKALEKHIKKWEIERMEALVDFNTQC